MSENKNENPLEILDLGQLPSIEIDRDNPAATLYRKLAMVMAQLERVPKNGRNREQNYDFATDADVLDTVRGVLARHRVAFLAHIVGFERKEAGKTSRGTITYHTLIHFQYTFACGDTGYCETKDWYGESLEWSDKGFSKAATSAEKYFLLKTFMLSTGEIEDDPDEQTVDPSQQQNRGPSNRQPAGKQGSQKPAGKPAQQSGQQQAGQQSSAAQTWATAEKVNKLMSTLRQKLQGVADADIFKAAGVKNAADLAAWAKHASGQAAYDKVVAALTQPAKPKAAKQSPWTPDNIADLNGELWRGFQKTENDFLPFIDGENFQSTFPFIEAAWSRCIDIAVDQNWPMFAEAAVYNGKYIEFQTPSHVRIYGRSDKFKAMVGDDYYHNNGIDKWTARSEPYQIDTLMITWEKKQFEGGTGLFAKDCAPVDDPFDDDDDNILDKFLNDESLDAVPADEAVPV